MAKNKTLLQTLGFAFRESELSFASQCVFTTLGEEAVESMGGVTDYLVEQIFWNPFSPLMEFVSLWLLSPSIVSESVSFW